MKNEDRIKIEKDRRLGLAIAFDSACMDALSEAVPGEMLRMTKQNGIKTLESCQYAFSGMDRQTYEWLERNGLDLKSFYSKTAKFIVDRFDCRNLASCRKYLRAIFRNPSNQRAIIADIVSRKNEDEKNKSVMRSILLSIVRLCDLTFAKNRVGRPSDVLKSIMDNGSLWRYLGGTLSYHFMSLVPDIGKAIEGSSGQVDFRNVNRKVMIDEYREFYESLAQYRYESVRACNGIAGNAITIKGILPFTDEYYCTKYVPEHSGRVK